MPWDRLAADAAAVAVDAYQHAWVCVLDPVCLAWDPLGEVRDVDEVAPAESPCPVTMTRPQQDLGAVLAWDLVGEGHWLLQEEVPANIKTVMHNILLTSILMITKEHSEGTYPWLRLKSIRS